MAKKKKEKTVEEELQSNGDGFEDASGESGQAETDTGPSDDENAAGERAEPEVEDALADDSIPLEEKLELVKSAWEASEAKAAEYLDGWQRAKAEFSNYKKRVNRDREQYNKDAVGRVTRNYLPVVDDLERALKDQPENGDNKAWTNGIELIYRKLVTAMENDGVVSMDVDGEMFDPNLHEAVVQIESPDHESGQIVDVIQTG